MDGSVVRGVSGREVIGGREAFGEGKWFGREWWYGELVGGGGGLVGSV